MELPHPTHRFFRQITILVLLVSTPMAGSMIAQRNRLAEQSFSPAVKAMLPQVAAKYRIPGLVVALIQNGRVVGIETFGVLDTKSKAPITENTVFEAGTLSEPVFAYAVLELAAEGRLDLGAPVTQYFPLPYLRNPNPFSSGASSTPVDQITDVRFDQITGIRILNHTSGLPNWALNDHLRLLFPPGEKWSYSSEGEVYLQRAVEHVTGQPFDDLVSRTVLGPYGMTHSSYVWRSDYEGSTATGYDANGRPISPNRYALAIGPKTLYTTAVDYARFVSIVLASSVRQRLHEGIVSLMLQPTVTVDDSISFSWGMGWGLENSANGPYFFNWSAQPGFDSFVMASRKTGDGVIVFTNSDNGLEAARDIVQAALGGDHPAFKSPLLIRR